MINQVALTGRLTRDIEVKYTQNGTAVASFTLAVDRNFTNADGEREVDFINCVIWRKSAENLAKYTHKGSLIGVQGRLQVRSYDNRDDQHVSTTEAVIDNFAFLQSRNQQDSHQSPQEQHNAPQQNVTQSQQTRQTPPDPFASNEQLDISDDDLPF